MKRFLVISNKFTNLDDCVINQYWKPQDKRYFMEFEGDDLEVRDEYHSMDELYDHRMALNIFLFKMMFRLDAQVRGSEATNKPYIMKSKLHGDGTMFEGGYFIVMATTNQGQISYHYKLEHWDKFDIPEVERTPEYDGHTSKDVIERLMKL